MKLHALGAALAVLLAAHPAAAEVLRGEVVGVVDGDTVKVLDADRRQHRIRLGAIDAPERRQAWSDRAKQRLSELVFRKQVEVRWEKRDRYGRIVGRVLVAKPGCEGDCHRSVDAGLELVRSGHAWWYRRYANEQAPDDRRRYERAEEEARRAKRGLWSDPKPTPPWEFRRRGRKGR